MVTELESLRRIFQLTPPVSVGFGAAQRPEIHRGDARNEMQHHHDKLSAQEKFEDDAIAPGFLLANPRRISTVALWRYRLVGVDFERLQSPHELRVTLTLGPGKGARLRRRGITS